MKRMRDAIVGWMTIFGVWQTWGHSEERQYWEYATDSRIVRYSQGPGEMASLGSYAVHIYDQAGIEWLTGIVRPRDGSMQKVWVIPGERKPKLQIWIWIACAGSGSYGHLELLEVDGKSLRHVPLPGPEKALLHGYMGHDEFFIENGKVYRKFPVYQEGDSNAGPSGGTRCLEMDLEKMKWSLSNHIIK